MQVKKSEIEIIRQLFNSLNENDKKELLKSLKNDKQNKVTHKTKEISYCPHCKSTSFTKNGTKNGSQRFICKECGKTFTTTNNTILYNTKKSLGLWKQYIHCLTQKLPLRKTAQICNISLAYRFCLATQNLRRSAKYARTSRIKRGSRS